MSDLSFSFPLPPPAAPQGADAFAALSRAVFSDGTLDPRTKALIAVAVAHGSQCPACLHERIHAAREAGASRDAIMEAIWDAAEMRLAAASARSASAAAENGGG